MKPPAGTLMLAALVGSLVPVACGTPDDRSSDRASGSGTAPPLVMDTAPNPPPATAGVAATLDLRRLVGSRSSARGELPPGLAPMAGWVIFPAVDQPIEFRITDAYYQGHRVLLLERVYQRDASGQLTWEVADAMSLPAIPTGYTLVRGGCSATGKADGSIAAVARNDAPAGGAYRAVMRAWRADLTRRRFGEIPVTGLRCVNQPAGGR